MTQRIVVGIDGSPHSSRALEWAVNEAKLRKADVEVVHAYSAPWEHWAVPIAAPPMDEVKEMRRQLVDQEVTKVLAGHNGVQVKQFVANDLPARMLIDHGKGADLLVVGSRGHGGFTGLLLGSVSQQVAHHAPCPVVIIP